MKEKVLINRYHIKEVCPSEKQAHSIIASVFRNFEAVEMKVEYVKGKNRFGETKTRVQVSYFDADELIKHYESKIEQEDNRFTDAQRRILRYIEKAKELALRSK